MFKCLYILAVFILFSCNQIEEKQNVKVVTKDSTKQNIVCKPDSLLKLNGSKIFFNYTEFINAEAFDKVENYNFSNNELPYSKDNKSTIIVSTDDGSDFDFSIKPVYEKDKLVSIILENAYSDDTDIKEAERKNILSIIKRIYDTKYGDGKLKDISPKKPKSKSWIELLAYNMGPYKILSCTYFNNEQIISLNFSFSKMKLGNNMCKKHPFGEHIEYSLNTQVVYQTKKTKFYVDSITNRKKSADELKKDNKVKNSQENL